MNLYYISFILLISTTSLYAQTIKDSLFKEARRGHRSFNYTEARKRIFNDLDLKQDAKGYYIEGVYCQNKHYPFNGEHPNGRIPDHSELNTEHTWPQSKFTTGFKKGLQKSYLHHLFPANSKINSDRGNFPFADVNPTRNISCDLSRFGEPVRGGKGSYFEPPQAHKGNVARAMFYFSVRYQVSIDPVQEYYLRLWHAEDPVDANEKKRHEMIYEIQGNRNPFIDNPQLVEQVEDF